MKKQPIMIGSIPAVIWGEPSDRAFLYVHGKQASKEAAGVFAGIAAEKGYQTLSFDLPGHGERQGLGERWDVPAGKRDLLAAADYAFSAWREVSLFACSLGVWYSLQVLGDRPLRQCLFQSPIVDMEYLTGQMMAWFDVTPERLEREREIETPIDLMTWDYYRYVSEHPVGAWDHPTYILCGGRDELQSLEVIRRFSTENNAALTVAEGSGHAFLDPGDEALVRDWISASLEASPDSAPRKPKKVVILATGGTIAGVGARGKTARYASGTLTAEDLIREVPAITSVAEIEAIQVCNINSDDVTGGIWIGLAERINAMAADPDVAGFVITHGTDTMEETAYFLNLTVKTDKPVVLTGSMRPSTAISADGPMNLYQAACVAVSEKAAGQGVLVVFSDRIYAARSVSKTSTYHVTAISGGVMGAVGVVRDGVVDFYETPLKRHTVRSEFDVTGRTALPRVSILYFAADADPELLRFAAERSQGIVIAGAGAGEFSGAYKKVIESLSIPVVVSSRIDDGVVITDNLLCPGTVAANNLSPQKAAILLRLALLGPTDTERLQRLYSEY